MAQSTHRSDNDSLAVALLREDHFKVEGLFADYDGSFSPSRRHALAARICAMLRVHMEVKERLFYPFLRINLDDTEIVDKAESAHTTLRDVIEPLGAAAQVDDIFDARMMVLGQYVARHVRMLEEDIYPLLGHLRKHLDVLGKEMGAVRETLQARLAYEDEARLRGQPDAVHPQRNEAALAKAVGAGKFN